jgi:MFS family permease
LGADRQERNGTRRTLAATLTTTIGANLPAFLLGGLAVQMQEDLHFGPTGVGVGVGAFYAAGAISSALTGRVVERAGAERSLRGAAFLSGCVQLSIAAFGSSITLVVAMLAVGGLANAWAQPASNVLLARVVPRARLGVALGVQKSAIPASALLGGLAVPAFALTVGWRWAFVAGAAFAFASAAQVPGARSGAVARIGHRPEGKPDVPTKHLLFLAAGVGLGSSASNSLSAFLVLSGVAAGLSEGTSGLLLTFGSVAGIGVRLLVGSRADRYPGHTLIVMAAMFAVASTSFVLLATGVEALFVLATPIAFATAYAWPGLFHLAVVRTNPSAPGAATGLTMTGTLAGAVAGPVIFGAIATHGSYAAAWLVATAFLLGAAVIVGLSSRLIREPSTSPSPSPAAPA